MSLCYLSSSSVISPGIYLTHILNANTFCLCESFLQTSDSVWFFFLFQVSPFFLFHQVHEFPRVFLLTQRKVTLLLCPLTPSLSTALSRFLCAAQGHYFHPFSPHHSFIMAFMKIYAHSVLTLVSHGRQKCQQNE